MSRRSARRTLYQNIAVSTALLVIVLMGTTMAVVHYQVAGSLRRGLQAKALSMARSLGAVSTPSLLSYNYAALQMAAEGAAKDEGVAYVIIHDKEGTVAGMAGIHSRQAADLHATSAGILDPTTLDVQVPLGDGKTASVLEVGCPVLVEGVGKPWGQVRVGLSYAPVRSELGRLVLHLFGLGAALVLAAVLAGRWIALRITAPLRRLGAASEALAAGDMSQRIPEAGPKELADLSRAFNAMVDRVQEKALESAKFQVALEALNDSLEWQVRERTRALEESEEQYKTLVEHSPDSILIVQSGRVHFVNRAFTETFGLSEDEILEGVFDFSRVFDPSSTALALGRIQAWEQGESAAPAEVLGRDGRGNIRHLELRGSRIEYRGQSAAECLLVDMTEAKRLRERLNETEKLSALGELSGGVAHDFNNLLGAILGRVQLLRRRGFASDVDRELSIIEKAAQDGGETVRRIQDFSRTRRDRPLTTVDLGEIIRDSVEITRTRWKDEAERRNVKVEVCVKTPPLPPIQGNAAELREVFTNLILNALDAMPQGGRLALSARRDGLRVQAEVSDTGVGMTETIRAHIFDPFFTTKGNRGMGLGLSVVYGIVTRHDGKIEVVSDLGKGTTFALEFPASSESVKVVGGDGAAVPAFAPKGRILVIDDEPEVAAVVRDVLVAEGHIVETVSSGADGVQLASVTRFDLVLTDLGMPDMSGWEVAKRIRSARPGIPVALVTGWGSTLDDEEARRKGIAVVIHKPFDIDHLIRTTAAVLAERATHA